MAPLPRPVITKYTQLTNDGRQKWGLLLTDGSRVYFRVREAATRTFHFYQVPAAGGEATKIPMPFRRHRISAISPDKANFLVFAGETRVRGYNVWPAWLVPITGGSPRRLGDIWGNDGTWTPDGKQIIYINRNDLYVAKSDGTGSRKLVSLVGRTWRPRFSPDGGRLRFDIYNPEQVGTYSPWEVSLDGTNLHRLLADWYGGIGNWSADGKYYFLNRMNRDDNDRDLWALREKGGLFGKGRGELIRLTDGPIDIGLTVPSPDGKKIFAILKQRRVELSRFDMGSGEFVPFLERISARWPDFTRDGEWVTYTDFPEETLWRMKMDGSQRLHLARLPMRAIAPRWSPDGKQIAFMGLEPSNPWKIYLISADGGIPRQLTKEDRTEGDPTWSPDGNSLIFGLYPTPENPNLPIYLYDLTTRQASPLPGSEGLWRPQ